MTRPSRRKDPETERIRAMTRKLADDNKARRARAAVEDAKAAAVRMQRQADARRHTDALATYTAVQHGESVSDFIARGGLVEVLPVNWQNPVPRRYVSLPLY